MHILDTLKEYSEISRSDEFIEYEKKFATKLSEGLAVGYQNSLNEPELVESIVNEFSELYVTRDKFELLTNSIFIHGNKSQVEFDYYGRKVQRELGDLIFLITLSFDDRCYFERLTINQCKKDKSGTKDITWDMTNKEQLYLLSRFPAFTVVKGLIPQGVYNLPNYSGCLGSYGLLHKPGDFIFLSAKKLDNVIGANKTLKINKLQSAFDGNPSYIIPNMLITNPDFIYYLYRYLPESMIYFLSINPLAESHSSAYNAFDFVHKFLEMGIGEHIFIKDFAYNSQVRKFFHSFLKSINHKARIDGNKDIQSFVEKYFSYQSDDSYPGFEPNYGFYPGSSIGIIHVIINIKRPHYKN